MSKINKNTDNLINYMRNTRQTMSILNKQVKYEWKKTPKHLRNNGIK